MAYFWSCIVQHSILAIQYSCDFWDNTIYKKNTSSTSSAELEFFENLHLNDILGFFLTWEVKHGSENVKTLPLLQITVKYVQTSLK